MFRYKLIFSTFNDLQATLVVVVFSAVLSPPVARHFPMLFDMKFQGLITTPHCLTPPPHYTATPFITSCPFSFWPMINKVQYWGKQVRKGLGSWILKARNYVNTYFTATVSMVSHFGPWAGKALPPQAMSMCVSTSLVHACFGIVWQRVRS